MAKRVVRIVSVGFAWMVSFANGEEEPTARVEVKLLVLFQVLEVVVESAVVKTPVELLYARGYTAESEVEEILLVKVVKSAAER